MGVHNLIKHIKSSFNQIFFNNELLHWNSNNNNLIKFIGIDGSHFLHYCINNNNNKKENGSSDITDIESNAEKISTIIFYYVERVCKIFRVEKNGVILYCVTDGYPPVSKNKIYEKRRDIYKEIDVKKLMKLSFKKLKIKIKNNLTDITFNFLTNFECNDKDRGEGEIELFKFANDLSINHNNNNDKNIIISLDSDILAMMIFVKNPSIILLTPNFTTNTGYLYDLNTLSEKLNLNYDQLINFIILHFMYFGSDYNYGLLNNNSSNSVGGYELKTIIYDAVVRSTTLNFYNVLEIAKLLCNNNNFNEDDCYLNKQYFLEAICAIIYYISLGKNKNILKVKSPLLYKKQNNKQQQLAATL